MDPLSMRQAGPEELPAVMDLLGEVSAWLVSRGIHQWASPPEPSVLRLMERTIAAGEVYLAWLPRVGDAAGLVRFEWHDPHLWPADPDNAGYIHSLAVRPRHHGRALGAGIIRWAAAHVRARGRRYLRLDCMANNLVLRGYYERLGFRYCGLASHAGYTGALFELDLSQDPDGPSPSGAW